MILSALKAIPQQQFTLWDMEDHSIRCMAQTRNLCGNFFEQATAALTGAKQHRTDARADMCPDLSLGEDYFESKSIGCTARSILYLRRIANDSRLRKQHPDKRLYYCLWHHKSRMEGIKDKRELRKALSVTLCHCTLLPFEIVRDCIRRHPLKMLNKQYANRREAPTGYNTKTYGRGWSVALTEFEDLCGVTLRHPGLSVAGVQTVPFEVRTVREAKGFVLDCAGR